jgi:predicted GIY-YIG superfamily endonuclease
MWYTYILLSKKDNKHYIGSTNDLTRRMNEHNSGCVQATKSRQPLELVSYIAVKTERQARDLELYLKTGSGFAFIKKRILQST